MMRPVWIRLLSGPGSLTAATAMPYGGIRHCYKKDQGINRVHIFLLPLFSASLTPVHHRESVEDAGQNSVKGFFHAP